MIVLLMILKRDTFQIMFFFFFKCTLSPTHFDLCVFLAACHPPPSVRSTQLKGVLPFSLGFVTVTRETDYLGVTDLLGKG